MLNAERIYDCRADRKLVPSIENVVEPARVSLAEVEAIHSGRSL